MVKLDCPVCLDSFPIDQFLFLQCGHGFCITCTATLAKWETCAKCRKLKDPIPPHQLFVEFSGTDEDQAKRLADRLERMDATSISAAAVKTTSRKIRELANTKTDGEIRHARLVEVAQHLDQRVYPLVQKYELEKLKVKELQRRLNDLKTKFGSAKKLEEENVDLVVKLQEALERAEDALAQMTQADKKAAREIAKSDQLKEVVERQKSVIRQKEADNVKMRGDLEESNKKVNLLKRKLKALTRSSATESSRKVLHRSPDDSLIVESPIKARTLVRPRES